MKCKGCPLFDWDYSSPEYPVKRCYLFGYEDSRFMYEDKKGNEGCYVDRNYIMKIAKECNHVKDGEHEK